jgi:RND family efflux transporter MFP subunit
MDRGAAFKTLRVVVVLLVSVAIAVILMQLRPRAEKSERPAIGRLVEGFHTHPQTVPMVIEAYGTVAPRESLTLVAQVRGQVVAMHPAFVEGGLVKAGEALLTIDLRDYRLAVERAAVGVRQSRADLDRLAQDVRNLNASLELARSDVALAAAEARRLKKLAGRDMASQSALDKADRQYLTSRERLQSLENQLAVTGPERIRRQSQLEIAELATEQARLDLARCRVAAPYDAWVTSKSVETGQHVSVGQQVGRIYRAGAFDIDVKIPVSDLAWFPDGGAGGIGLDAEVVFAETRPPGIWTGRVARIKADLDPTTRTLPVVIAVDEPAAHRASTQTVLRMRPGMFVTVRIQGRRVDNVHRLPRHLIRDDDAVYLFIDGQLHIRPVTVLRRLKTDVLVSEGLSDGDLVITTPVSNAVDGMRIRIDQIGGLRD